MSPSLLVRPALACFLLALLFVLPAGAQSVADRLNRVQGLLQTQQYDSASALLEELTAQRPDHGRAWSLLGFARQSMDDVDGAIEAYGRAIEFDDVAPRAMYGLGIQYARKGDVETAFEWLARADATGRVDMTQIGIDPNAEPLRGDPRYRALFPTESEFADPFVEDVSIVHEWVGEAAGDQFGWIARNIGDVDGDGVNDVTTSAPTNNEGGQAAGKVYAYSGKTGQLLWERVGPAGAQLGLGIEAAGDVNADGVPDVIAGGPGVGRTWVYSGRNGEDLLVLEAEAEGDVFGRKVSDVGDVDGDGHDDVMVGAPSNDESGDNAGKSYVYSGRTGRVLWSARGQNSGDAFGSAGAGFVSEDGMVWLVVGAPGVANGGRTYVYKGLEEEPAFVIDADETGSSLGGMFVSVVGDVDTDGVPDVYASDWSNNAKGASTGRVFVHSGANGTLLHVLTGEAAGDGFGIGPADAGDVDGDGYDDLVIGAWQHASAAPSGGKIYLYSGRTGEVLDTFTGKVPGETLGFDATGMGDVNGDGVIDLLVTSAWSAINGTRSGRMFIVSGRVGS
jgi:hypothetical protein